MKKHYASSSQLFVLRSIEEKGFAEAPDTGNLENKEEKQSKPPETIRYRFRSFPMPEPSQPLLL